MGVTIIKMSKTYVGRKKYGLEVKIQEYGIERRLTPGASIKLVNHSPTGFCWGYAGSGPAQLALAILLDVTANKLIALDHYQDFKWAFVARWGDSFSITDSEVFEWLSYVNQN